MFICHTIWEFMLKDVVQICTNEDVKEKSIEASHVIRSIIDEFWVCELSYDITALFSP